MSQYHINVTTWKAGCVIKHILQINLLWRSENWPPPCNPHLGNNYNPNMNIIQSNAEPSLSHPSKIVTVRDTYRNICYNPCSSTHHILVGHEFSKLCMTTIVLIVAVSVKLSMIESSNWNVELQNIDNVLIWTYDRFRFGKDGQGAASV